MVCHALVDKKDSDNAVASANLIPENVAFCSIEPHSEDNKKAPMSCAGDFLSFANWENTLNKKWFNHLLHKNTISFLLTFKVNIFKYLQNRWALIFENVNSKTEV